MSRCRRTLLWVALATGAFAGTAQPAETIDLEGADPMFVARLAETRRRVEQSPDDAAAWLDLGELARRPVARYPVLPR